MSNLYLHHISIAGPYIKVARFTSANKAYKLRLSPTVSQMACSHFLYANPLAAIQPLEIIVMAKLTYGSKSTMRTIRPKYIPYCSKTNELDLDWLNLNGWRKRLVKLKHRNCNSKIEWWKKSSERLYTIRKYGDSHFKVKWVRLGSRQPCCRGNQGSYWNCQYFDNWGDVINIVVAINENMEAIEQPLTEVTSSAIAPA